MAGDPIIERSNSSDAQLEHGSAPRTQRSSHPAGVRNENKSGTRFANHAFWIKMLEDRTPVDPWFPVCPRPTMLAGSRQRAPAWIAVGPVEGTGMTIENVPPGFEAFRRLHPFFLNGVPHIRRLESTVGSGFHLPDRRPLVLVGES